MDILSEFKMFLQIISNKYESKMITGSQLSVSEEFENFNKADRFFMELQDKGNFRMNEILANNQQNPDIGHLKEELANAITDCKDKFIKTYKIRLA